MISIKVISPPSFEPVTLDELKGHLIISGSNEDDYLSSLILAASIDAENYCNRSFASQTLEEGLSYFPKSIRLSRSPVQSVESLTYYDTDGVEVTLDPEEYHVDTDIEPAVITPKTCWPAAIDRSGAIRIRYVAGWESADKIPTPIKQAILMKAGKLYCTREDSKQAYPDASMSLLNHYRIWTI